MAYPDFKDHKGWTPPNAHNYIEYLRCEELPSKFESIEVLLHTSFEPQSV